MYFLLSTLSHPVSSDFIVYHRAWIILFQGLQLNNELKVKIERLSAKEKEDP